VTAPRDAAPADLFSPLSADTLRAIAASGVVRQFPKNAVLINEGEHADSLFIVLSGKVKVYASNEAGKEVVIDFHGPGEYVGVHPDFALHLIEMLIRRVRHTTESVKSLALSDVYGRLVRLLLSLAVERDGRLVVPEKLTQQDIAERVGASRDMISRLMKDLVGGGYLSIEERTITILRKPPPGW